MVNPVCAKVPTVRTIRTTVTVATLLVALAVSGCATTSWRRQLQSENPIDRINGTIAAAHADDRSALPLLVDRLEDDDQAVRMYAILALQQIEGTTLGYKYWAGPADLSHMAQRWRRHLKQTDTSRQAQASQPSPFGFKPQGRGPHRPIPPDGSRDAPTAVPPAEPLAQETQRE